MARRNQTATREQSENKQTQHTENQKDSHKVQ